MACLAEAFATFSFLDMQNEASIQFTHYSLWLLEATRAIKRRLLPQPFNVQMYLVERVVSLTSQGGAALPNAAAVINTF